MPLPEVEELMAAAEDAARQAGALLVRAFGGVQTSEVKSHARDLVTQIDLESERLILDLLGERWPEIGLLAEETGLTRAPADALWVVDPLDGTANFARGYPVFCISIACIDRDGPLAGVIFDPLRNELFSAGRGRGATLNGRTIAVSSVQDLSGALFTTGYPYSPPEERRRAGEIFVEVMMVAAAARRSGSAALDLAHVAAGRSEVHYELNLAPHDVAAGILLVHEAGGRVDMLTPEGERPRSGRYPPGWPHGTVATNGAPLHEELLGMIVPPYRMTARPFSFSSLFG